MIREQVEIELDSLGYSGALRNLALGLAESIDAGPPAHSLAGLSRELRQVLAEVRALCGGSGDLERFLESIAAEGFRHDG